MKIVNDMKFSTRNVSPLGLALGAVYISAASVGLKIGVQSLIYGLGFRGKFTVLK